MYLLIDECCGKGLVAVARSAGHVAQRSIEVAKLGRGAPDTDIFSFARANTAVIVTINQGDFLKLARRTFERPGIIVLPSARGSVLARVFATALPRAATVFETHPNAIVQIDAAGRIADIAIE
jgi:predicted nuclease of predicted toxin-antitoxin system